MPIRVSEGPADEVRTAGQGRALQFGRNRPNKAMQMSITPSTVSIAAAMLSPTKASPEEVSTAPEAERVEFIPYMVSGFPLLCIALPSGRCAAG